MKITPQGFAVLDADKDNALSKHAADLGRLDYCIQIPAHYLPHIKPGMVCIDTGAAIGDHTIAYARACGDPKLVHAFECGPDMIECLRYNCPAVNIYPVALSDSERTSYYHPDNGNAGASYMDDNPDGGIPVSVATLDSFHIKDVGFIKWDIEGHEVRAIRGAVNTIMATKPLMMIEVIEGQLKRAGSNNTELFQILDSLGYRYSPVIGNINTIGEYFELRCEPN